MRLLSMPAVYVRSQTLQRPPTHILHAPTLHSAGGERQTKKQPTAWRTANWLTHRGGRKAKSQRNEPFISEWQHKGIGSGERSRRDRASTNDYKNTMKQKHNTPGLGTGLFDLTYGEPWSSFPRVRMRGNSRDGLVVGTYLRLGLVRSALERNQLSWRGCFDASTQSNEVLAVHSGV